MKLINDKPTQILPVKHVGSFLLLMLLATLRPMAIWPQFTLSLEPVTILVVGLLLCYKIYLTIGFKRFWVNYKIQLILLALYFAVCFFSLYLNHSRFKDTAEFIRYGVTFVVITGVFPTALLLFALPQNTNGLSLTRIRYASKLPWLYFALLALMVIWQYIDYEGAKSIGQFFVSSELWPKYNINGFFRVSTDISPVLALLVVMCLITVLQVLSQGGTSILSWLLLGTLLLLFIVSGAVTGSRVFVLMLMVASIVALFKSNLTLTNKVLLLLVLFSVGHVVVTLFSPMFMRKLTLFMPYLKVLYYGIPFDLTDLNINLSIEATVRGDIWSAAWESIKQNPLFGVTSGVVRLTGPVEANTHNFIFQLLVNSGVIGLAIVCMLAITIKKHLSHPLVIVLIVSLLVDYPLEHSLPWIIVVCYILSVSMQQNQYIKPIDWNYYPLVSRYLMPVCFLISIVMLVTIYQSRQHVLLNQSQAIRLSTQINARLDENFPILIDSEFLNYKDFRDVRYFHWYRVNQLDSQLDLCHYGYLPNRYSFSNASQSWLNFVGQDECKVISQVATQLDKPHHWVTNMVHWGNDRQWNFLGSMGIWSPFIEIDKELNLTFRARGRYGLGSWPTAQITLFNDERQVVEQRQLSINSAEFADYSVTLPIEKKGKYYLSIYFVNDAYDKATKQDRNMWVEKSSVMVNAGL